MAGHFDDDDLQVALPGATFSLVDPKQKTETLSIALGAMKRMPSMVSMLNSLSLNPQARILLERAVANVAIQCGGTQSFFSSVNTLQDYSTDVELMGHPLPNLTNPNHHLNSRTE